MKAVVISVLVVLIISIIIVYIMNKNVYENFAPGTRCPLAENSFVEYNGSKYVYYNNSLLKFNDDAHAKLWGMTSGPVITKNIYDMCYNPVNTTAPYAKPSNFSPAKCPIRDNIAVSTQAGVLYKNENNKIRRWKSMNDWKNHGGECTFPITDSLIIPCIKGSDFDAYPSNCAQCPVQPTCPAPKVCKPCPQTVCPSCPSCPSNTCAPCPECPRCASCESTNDVLLNEFKGQYLKQDYKNISNNTIYSKYLYVNEIGSGVREVKYEEVSPSLTIDVGVKYAPYGHIIFDALYQYVEKQPDPSTLKRECYTYPGVRLAGAGFNLGSKDDELYVNGKYGLEISATDCQKTCESNPECKQYVQYTDPNGGIACYLMKNAYPTNFDVTNPFYTSGECNNRRNFISALRPETRQSIDQRACVEYDRTRLAGGDSDALQPNYGATANTFDECREQCRQDLECKQVVYNDIDKRCFRMKNEYPLQNAIKDDNFRSAVCNAKPASCPFPDGTIFHKENGGGIYKIEEGKARHVPNMETYYSIISESSPQVQFDESTLRNCPEGTQLPSNTI